MSAGIVHTGDWGVPLTLTFTDRSGAAVSLAGATVTLGLISPTGTRVDRTATVSGDGTAGVAVYTTTTSDFTTAGRWSYQGVATWSNAKLQSDLGAITVTANTP